MSQKKEKKQAEMPDDPMKESFRPWFTHKLSSNKEFAGYEWEMKLDSKGRQKRVMVYHGDYYYFNYKGAELKKVRRKVAILCIISLILIFATSGFITASSVSNAIVSTCELFALIPTIYEIMGLWTLCNCKEPFEMSVPMLSVRRMKSSALGIMVLIGVAGVLHIYLMFRNLGNGMLIPDLIVAIGMVSGFILQFVMRRILLTFSLEKVGDEEKDAAETETIKRPENITFTAEGTNVSDSEAVNDASKNTENADTRRQTDSDTCKAPTSETSEDSTSSEMPYTNDSGNESADSQAGKTVDNTGNTKKKKHKNRTKKQKRTGSNGPDSVDSHPQDEGETDKDAVSSSEKSENSTFSVEESVISGSESDSSDCKSQDEVENT